MGYTGIQLMASADSIKRPIRAGWLTIAIALAMVSVALCSTVVDNLSTFRFFLFYFFITIAFVLFMFYRLILLRIGNVSTLCWITLASSRFLPQYCISLRRLCPRSRV